MGTKAGAGISRHRDPRQAGREAVQEAFRAANLETCDLVVMYSTIGLDQQAIVNSVRELVGGARLIGCSAEGVIAGGEVDESNFAVAVMVIKSDELRFVPHLVTGLKERPREVGELLAAKLKPELANDSLAVMILGDGITINFDKFNAGFEAALGRPNPPDRRNGC
jgi:hypothetical protein